MKEIHRGVVPLLGPSRIDPTLSCPLVCYRAGRQNRSRIVTPALDVELTVRENLLVYSRYFGLPRRVIRERTAALLATPMRPAQVALGEIGWALIRGTIYAIAFIAVMLALDLVHSPWAVLDVPVAVLIGFGFAALAQGVAGLYASGRRIGKLLLV